MIILKKKICLLIVILFNLTLFSSFSFAEVPRYNKILSLEDVRVYKQIFDIQKNLLEVRNRKSG